MTKKTANWIIEEYKKGNMVDYNGDKIEPVKFITTSIRTDIIDQYENDNICHVSEF